MPYTLPNGTILPSVTEILSATTTKKQRDRLTQWNLDNPGAGEIACQRGIAVHEAVANYLLQPQPRLPRLPSEILFGKLTERNHYQFLYNSHTQSVSAIASAHYRSVLPWISEIDKVYWAEHEVGGAKNKFVWSNKGYAGRPDILGEVDGKLTLIDLKTSEVPYTTTYSSTSQNFAGYAKFCRAATQLAAYAIAVEETLGLVPQQLLVLIAQSDNYQVMEINQAEWARASNRWLRCLEEYVRNLAIKKMGSV